MTQREEPIQGCGCPEVYLRVDERVAAARLYTGEVPEWIRFCVYRERFTKPGIVKVPLDSTSPEPITWRCPRCKGSIIRTGVTPVTSQDMDELQAVDDFFGVDASVSPDLTPVDQYVRIYYRCSSQSCGWNDFVVTWPGEGLVAGAEADGQHE